MKLKYDATTIRFFLPWLTAVRIEHDVAHDGLNAVADSLLELPFVQGVDIGSGHCGIYFDIHLKCEPSEIAQRISEIVEHAKTLKV